MRIALIGYGGVGKAFLKLLNDKGGYLKEQGINVKVNYVLNSSGGVYNPKGIDCAGLIKHTCGGGKLSEYRVGGSKNIDFKSILSNKDVDMIIETTPTNKDTGEPGMTHIAESLRNGMHVITANKGPILLAYKRLNELAVENGVQLGIGCTTGGALPSINGGLIDMAGSDITSIEGVLNGTTNYILNEMEQQGTTYDEALRKAQELGIAEADPTLDVEGWDTASKLLILTNVLMGMDKTLNDIEVKGITGILPLDVSKAKEEGKKYKLVGRTANEGGRLKMTVQPEMLGRNHPLYVIDGKNKGVRYVSDTLGDLTISGGASGIIPAAASILRDLINIHRGYKFSR